MRGFFLDINTYSPFLGLPSSRNRNTCNETTTEWKLPEVYKGKSLSVPRGLDLEYERNEFVGSLDCKPKIRFYSLMICVSRIDFKLPNDVRRLLWVEIEKQKAQVNLVPWQVTETIHLESLHSLMKLLLPKM